MNAEDVKAVGSLASGIGSGLGAVTSLASGIMSGINSAHQSAQSKRQAQRLKNEETANLNEYLAALQDNGSEYLNALQGVDYDSLYDLSNYGYDTTGDKYDPDKFIDEEQNYIIQSVVDEANGKSALGGMAHGSGALSSAANAAVAKSNELRESARKDALSQQSQDLNTAKTLMDAKSTASDKYLDALKSVADYNNDIAGAKQSGQSSINTSYRQLMANV